MDNVEGPNKFNIDELFEQALNRIDAGESVDAILRSCPEEQREQLKSILPVVGGLNDITYSSVPSRSVETRQRGKSQFLMAAKEQSQQVVAEGMAEQEFVQAQPESVTVIDDAVDNTRLAASQPQRPTRTLIEPDAPTFFERISALFAVPTMRLAPFAFVALLLLGGGGYAASTSYAGHWAYPIKEFGRTVGLALVPDAAREQRVIAQSEATEKDIQRGIDVVNETNEESNFSQKVIVEKVEQSDDGAILHTNVGDFVVAEGQAPQVLLAAQNIKVGDVIEIDALIMPNDPAPLQVVELEVVATAPPPVEPTNVPAQAVAPTDPPCQLNVSGWQPYPVQPGDTLAALAIRGQVDYTILAQRNCIGNADNIVSGSTLYLPPAAFVQPASVNTATTVATVTVAPILIEQTPTEAPTVMPEVVVPDVIATPIPSLPTPVEVDGTVTLTITNPVQPTVDVEPTSTIEPTAIGTTTGPILTVTVTSPSTVTAVLTDVPTAVPTIAVTLPVTETATALPEDTNATPETVAPEATAETSVPTPTVVAETSPITTTQTITESTEVVTTGDPTTENEPDVNDAELESNNSVTTTQTAPETGLVETEQVSVTEPISGTVSEPVSEPPTEIPTVETTIVSTSTVPALEPTVVPTSTVLPATSPTTLPTAQSTAQPTVELTSESSGESLPENAEGISPIVPLTITVASETPALPAPEVSGASLDPTSTQAVPPTATEVATATTLVPIITVDAELIIAETATSLPIVTLEPTNPPPAASPIPVAPPPAQPTVPVIPPEIISPTAAPPGELNTPTTSPPDTSTAPVDVATTISSVPVVVEPAVIQPPATTSTDSSNQQLQTDEGQPTIIEPEIPAVSAATAVVDLATAVPASVATAVPQAITDTPIPPAVTAVPVAPTATTINLAPISPLTQP